ncbi:MAG: hypothetical protein WBW84_19975 [Acidobacteriaceae bacterium]
MANGTNALRVVIQQLGVAAVPRYRIIIYGDDQSPRHSDLDSAQILIDTLRAAVPDFDSSQLALNPLEEGKGSIVFTGPVELNNGQLAILGFS